MSRMRFFVASNLSTCAWPCLLASFITPRNVRAAPVMPSKACLPTDRTAKDAPIDCKLVPIPRIDDDA